MKECLNEKCKKEFENKKDTAKFCSTSCRVIWHRKNKGNPKGLTEKQKLDVLYNSILEMVTSVRGGTLSQKQADLVFKGTPTMNLVDEKPLSLLKPTVSLSDSFELKISKCKTIDDIKKVVAEIDASDLTFFPKKRLKDLAAEISKNFYND